jgi:hypothetical protein
VGARVPSCAGVPLARVADALGTTEGAALGEATMAAARCGAGVAVGDGRGAGVGVTVTLTTNPPTAATNDRWIHPA